jgi:hypothetical protein
LLLDQMVAEKAHCSEYWVDFGHWPEVFLRDHLSINYSIFLKDPISLLEHLEIKLSILIPSKLWLVKVLQMIILENSSDMSVWITFKKEKEVSIQWMIGQMFFLEVKSKEWQWHVYFIINLCSEFLTNVQAQ